MKNLEAAAATGADVLHLELCRYHASSTLAKKVAASAMTQSKAPNERASAPVAAAASKILQGNRFSKDAKTLAASVLSQRKK